MIQSKLRNKIICGLLLSTVILIVSIFFQYSMGSFFFKTKLFSVNVALATQNDIYWDELCLGTDNDGYTRLAVKFQHDQKLCWKPYSDPGCSSGWSYGKTGTWDNHLRLYLTNFGISNGTIVPTLPSETDWIANEGNDYCETFVADTVYNFYVAKTSAWCEGNDNSIDDTTLISSNYTVLAFAGGTDGGNWYQEPKVYWSDTCDFAETPTESDIDITSPSCATNQKSSFDLTVDWYILETDDYDTIDFYFVEDRYFDETATTSPYSIVYSKDINVGVTPMPLTYTVPYLPPGKDFKMYAIWRDSSTGDLFIPPSQKDGVHIKNCEITTTLSSDDESIDDYLSTNNVLGWIDSPIQEIDGSYLLYNTLDASGTPFDPVKHNSFSFKTNVGDGFDLELYDVTNSTSIVYDDIGDICTESNNLFTCVFDDTPIKDGQKIQLSIRIYDRTWLLYTLNFDVVGDSTEIVTSQTQFSWWESFLKWVLTPQKTGFDKIYTLYQELRYKFPWGYYFKFIDMISGSYADSTETADTLASSTLSFYVGESEVVVGTLTPNQDIVTGSSWDSLRTFVDYALWACFAFGVYYWVIDYRDRYMN